MASADLMRDKSTAGQLTDKPFEQRVARIPFGGAHDATSPGLIPNKVAKAYTFLCGTTKLNSYSSI